MAKKEKVDEVVDEQPDVPEVSEEDKLIERFGKDLYMRACKRIGMVHEQIKSYRTAELLKKACDHISPQTNPDARPKQGKGTPVSQHKPMPDSFDLESRLEASNMSRNRNQFDEGNLQAELRRINRAYGPQPPIRIMIDKSMEPISGKDKHGRNTKFIVTKYRIIMKG